MGTLRYVGTVLLAAGLAAVVLVPPAMAAPAPGVPEVLVVGDGVSRATLPDLRQQLPQAWVRSATRRGADSRQALELFRRAFRPSQSTIVFDAGQSDDPQNPLNLAANLGTLAAKVGRRCIVVPTVQAPTVNGVSAEGRNKVVFEFAESHRGVQVAEWAGAAESRPSLLRADDRLPSTSGARLRGRLLADAIERCLKLERGRSLPTSRRVKPAQVPPLTEIGHAASSAYLDAVGTALGRLGLYLALRSLLSPG